MHTSSHNTLETSLDPDTKQFYSFHGVQLVGIGFPANAELIKRLRTKLSNQNFDAGEMFEIFENEDTENFEYEFK